MDAEAASLIARRGNYSTAIGLAAYDDGLAAELGTIEEFNGDEEGVHVDVQDWGGLARKGRGFMLGAELGELGH
jgi:hypothetical protein